MSVLRQLLPEEVAPDPEIASSELVESAEGEPTEVAIVATSANGHEGVSTESDPISTDPRVVTIDAEPLVVAQLEPRSADVRGTEPVEDESDNSDAAKLDKLIKELYPDLRSAFSSNIPLSLEAVIKRLKVEEDEANDAFDFLFENGVLASMGMIDPVWAEQQDFLSLDQTLQAYSKEALKAAGVSEDNPKHPPNKRQKRRERR